MSKINPVLVFGNNNRGTEETFSEIALWEEDSGNRVENEQLWLLSLLKDLLVLLVLFKEPTFCL